MTFYIQTFKLKKSQKHYTVFYTVRPTVHVEKNFAQCQGSNRKGKLTLYRNKNHLMYCFYRCHANLGANIM